MIRDNKTWNLTCYVGVHESGTAWSKDENEKSVHERHHRIKLIGLQPATVLLLL